jgi:hypothetical protein
MPRMKLTIYESIGSDVKFIHVSREPFALQEEVEEFI